jgi:hypothetical protein
MLKASRRVSRVVRTTYREHEQFMRGGRRRNFRRSKGANSDAFWPRTRDPSHVSRLIFRVTTALRRLAVNDNSSLSVFAISLNDCNHLRRFKFFLFD